MKRGAEHYARVVGRSKTEGPKSNLNTKHYRELLGMRVDDSDGRE